MPSIAFRRILFVAVLVVAPGVALSATTTYTLPRDLHWIADRSNGAPPGAFYAILRGKDSDKCGELVRERFADGFVYPWHVNTSYFIYTVLQGTLVIGFNKNHLKSAERVLPTGSVMQGLKTEPHYGRAIGETIFDVYGPPCEMVKTTTH